MENDLLTAPGVQWGYCTQGRGHVKPITYHSYRISM
jgi:hypothetical protein